MAKSETKIEKIEPETILEPKTRLELETKIEPETILEPEINLKTKIHYIGSNPSYTVDKVKFERNKNIAEIDAEIAKRLIMQGVFIEI